MTTDDQLAAIRARWAGDEPPGPETAYDDVRTLLAELEKADAETLHRARIDAEDMHRLQAAYRQIEADAAALRDVLIHGLGLANELAEGERWAAWRFSAHTVLSDEQRAGAALLSELDRARQETRAWTVIGAQAQQVAALLWEAARALVNQLTVLRYPDKSTLWRLGSQPLERDYQALKAMLDHYDRHVSGGSKSERLAEGESEP